MVLLLDLGDGEQAVDEFDIPYVRVIDAQPHLLDTGAAERHAREGEVEIPGDPHEFVRPGVEVHVVIMPQAEETVEVGDEASDGDELQEVVDIDERANLSNEGRIVSLIDEPGQPA